MNKKAPLRYLLFVCALAVSVALPAAARSVRADTDAFSLNVLVDPPGKGTVDVDPDPPYSQNQVVTLTATPITGWLFDRWDVESDLVWWDNDWDYRVEVTAAAAGYARKDKPAEVALNFTQVWNSLGKTGTLDPNSLRVVEVDGDDNVIDETVAFQFDQAADFNAANKAAGTLVLIMEGNTPAGAERRYHVYFDVTGKGFSAPNVPEQIDFNDSTTDEARAAYRLITPVGTYFFHTRGGAFSSFNDLDGNDWISWNSAGGNNGDYRGLPNLVTPNNGDTFHPGRNSMNTTVVSQGPIKVSFMSVEKKNYVFREEWKGLWEVYPTYVKFTLLVAPYDYWFLYEGTPGGALQPATDFLVRSNGVQTSANTAWQEDIPDEEWVYVADPNVGRSLFIAGHIDDTKIDSYAQQGGVMTRLGLGRENANPLTDRTILPRYFTWGVMDETVYEDAKTVIQSAYKDLTVTVGAAASWAGASLGNTNPTEFTITGEHTVTAVFTPAQFTVTVTPSPGNGGIATRTPDKATYDYGEEVTLAAAPANGWAFSGWSGDVTGTENPVIVPVTSNLNVTANFAQSFTVTASANPPEGGAVVVTPSKPSYQPGEQIQVQALANNGYGFSGWSGDLSGSNPIQNVTVNGNLTIVANFSVAQYTFNALSGGNGSVDWAPKKDFYGLNEVVVVTATPDADYYFTGWTGDRTSTDNPLQVTITGNTAVTGNFAPIQYYTVTANAVGGGTVTKDPDLAQYPSGTVVTLTAVPDAQKNFIGWSGDVTGTDNPIQVTVTGNIVATATFGEDLYPLTVTIIGQGSVSKLPDQPAGYPIGQVVTLTASAAPGWSFTEWSGDTTGTNPTTAVTIDGATDVTATFTALGPFTLNVSATGDGDGTVDVNPEKAEYAWGEQVTLTAEAGPGSVFAGWMGDASGNTNPLTVTMNADKSIQANFIVPTGPFSDNFNRCDLDEMWGDPVNPTGLATFVPTGTHLELRLPAGANHNIWKNINNAPRVLQPADNTDMQVVAKFDSDVTQPSQIQGILVEKDDANLIRFDFNYLNGQVYVYSATLLDGVARKRLELPVAAADARFLRVTRTADTWALAYSGNGTAWQSAGSFAFPMTVVRVGVFAGNVGPDKNSPAPAFTSRVDFFQNTATGPVPEDTPLLSVNVVGGGTVSANPPADAVACGQTVSLTATPGLGWQFAGWSGDATGSQNPLSMLINRPRAVTATFTGSATRFVLLPMIIQ